MLKNNYVRGSVVCILAGLFLTSVALAVPTNGNFNDGLVPPWDYSGNVSVTDEIDPGNNYAWFQENTAGDRISSLSQEFILPAGSFEISFDRKWTSIGSGSPDTDSFTVSLLNADTLAPLTVYPSDPYDPGITWFYSLDTAGYELIDPTASSIVDLGNDWWRVTLDFSLTQETNTLLAFDFFSEVDPVFDEYGNLIPGLDGIITTVRLDNVNVSVPVIPAPAALGLGLIGTGLVSLLRRTKTIK